MTHSITSSPLEHPLSQMPYRWAYLFPGWHAPFLLIALAWNILTPVPGLARSVALHSRGWGQAAGSPIASAVTIQIDAQPLRPAVPTVPTLVNRGVLWPSVALAVTLHMKFPPKNIRTCGHKALKIDTEPESQLCSAAVPNLLDKSGRVLFLQLSTLKHLMRGTCGGYLILWFGHSKSVIEHEGHWLASDGNVSDGGSNLH